MDERLLLETSEEYAPIDCQGKDYFLEEIIFNYKKLTILLSSSDSLLKIQFDFKGRVFSFKKTKLIYKKKILDNVIKECDFNVVKKLNLFIVKNSDYAKKISAGSCGIYSIQDMLNYTFIVQDEFIEIITAVAPDVFLLTNSG